MAVERSQSVIYEVSLQLCRQQGSLSFETEQESSVKKTSACIFNTNKIRTNGSNGSEQKA